MTTSPYPIGDRIGGACMSPSPKISCEGDAPAIPKAIDRINFNLTECELLTSSINSQLERFGTDGRLDVPASSDSKNSGALGELDRINNRLITLREVLYQVEAKLRGLI